MDGKKPDHNSSDSTDEHDGASEYDRGLLRFALNLNGANRLWITTGLMSIQRPHPAAQYLQRILEQSSEDEMINTLIEYGREHLAELASSYVLDLNYIAFRLLDDIVVASMGEGRRDLARDLVTGAAPDDIQGVDQWLSHAGPSYTMLNRMVGQRQQPTSQGSAQPLNAISWGPTSAFAANPANANPSNQDSMPYMFAQQPQGFPPNPLYVSYTTLNPPPAAISSYLSAVITQPSFRNYPPLNTDLPHLLTSQIATATQGHPIMARTRKTSSSRRSPSPSPPPRTSARLNMFRKKQKQQQKEKPTKGGRVNKKTSSSTKAKPKTSSRLSKADLKRVGPENAPEGQRYLCPFHISPTGSTPICDRVSGNRRCLVRHVKDDHFNGREGWGSKASHWATCGPYTYRQLQQLGRKNGFTGRKMPGGRVEASFTAADVQGDDESEEEEEDEEEDEDEIMSDGDDAPDGGPPTGRKDDGNNGNGHGHGLAQLIAAA